MVLQLAGSPRCPRPSLCATSSAPLSLGFCGLGPWSSRGRRTIHMDGRRRPDPANGRPLRLEVTLFALSRHSHRLRQSRASFWPPASRRSKLRPLPCWQRQGHFRSTQASVPRTQITLPRPGCEPVVPTAVNAPLRIETVWTTFEVGCRLVVPGTACDLTTRTPPRHAQCRRERN